MDIKKEINIDKIMILVDIMFMLNGNNNNNKIG
jgi:hypothetical protein